MCGQSIRLEGREEQLPGGGGGLRPGPRKTGLMSLEHFGNGAQQKTIG